jgi:hypothetical protein
MNNITETLERFLKENGFSNEEIALTQKVQTSKDTWIASAPMLPKRFINQVLIREMGAVVTKSAWLAFVSIGCGIEFLGKCIDTENPTDWNIEFQSAKNFRDAIHNLNAFKKYHHLNKCRELTKKQCQDSGHFDLYTEFRCAMAHSYAPNGKVTLSHGSREMANLVENNGIVNFNIDELYQDFKAACEEIIAMNFSDPANKMNLPRIWITITINGNILETDATSSFKG